MIRTLIAMLLCSVTTTTIAQTVQRYNEGDVTAADNLRMTYYKEDKKQNTLKLELYGTRYADKTINIDSLISFAASISSTYKDSLPPEEEGRCITITCHTADMTEINIRSTLPSQKNYVRIKNESSVLKTMQDTIIINFYVNNDPVDPMQKFYRLSFFLNDISDIESFQNEHYNDIFYQLPVDKDAAWKDRWKGGEYLRKDPSILLYRSYDPLEKTAALTRNIAVGLQTLEKYLVPVASAGLGINTNKNYRLTWLGLSTEFHFTFTKDEKGAHHQHVNPFIVFSYKRINMKNFSRKYIYKVYKNFSVAYLLGNAGDRYKPNTFRIGITQFYLGNQSLRMEPAVLFNGFFRNGFPTLKLTQSF